MASPSDLVVEDGTGLDNANSYASIADGDTYHSLYSNTTWTDADGSQKATALVHATRYMDLRWEFFGEVVYPDDAGVLGQALKWPRTNSGASLIDARGNEIGDDEVPRIIIDATLEYALEYLLTGSLLPTPSVPDDAGRFVTLVREKLGPLESETRFSDTRSTSLTRKYSQADRMVRRSGLAMGVGGSRAVRA